MRASRPPGGQRGQERDGGFTLAEVVVAMSILSIVLASATGGMLSLYRAADNTQAIADAQQQLGLAFNRLDREIRYSAGISTPGFVGTDPSVELLTTYTGSPVCVQLRLQSATQQLEQRTWTQGTGSITPSAWNVLANGVTSTSQPFLRTVADSTLNFQRLAVALTVTGGGSGATSTRDLTATFTALNTSLDTNSPAVCAEGRTMP